jgi:general secretion pathway protein I
VNHWSRRAVLARGFTLIEVLVALVIVAFGVGAVLAALSSSAVNVSALREKTLAQWVALNRIADVRLNLQAPQTGTTEGDVRNFANGDWHWQQIVTAMEQIPGLMQVTVKVRRIPTNPGSSSGSNSSKTITYSSTPSISGTTSGKDSGDWITTVIGFRGDALAAASGETPSWSGTDLTGSSSSSSSGAGVTTGTVANPGSTNPPATPTPTTSTPGTPSVPGSSSSGGP